MHCSVGDGGVPTWSREVYLVAGVYLVCGCTRTGGGGVPALSGGYLPGPGGYTWSGGCVPGQVLPPWTEFLTHASQNITLPQTSFAGGNKLYKNTKFFVLSGKTRLNRICTKMPMLSTLCIMGETRRSLIFY